MPFRSSAWIVNFLSSFRVRFSANLSLVSFGCFTRTRGFLQTSHHPSKQALPLAPISKMAAAPHHWSPMTTAPAPPLRRRQFSSFSNSTITTSSTNAQPTLVGECKVVVSQLLSSLETLTDRLVRQAFDGGLTCSSSGVFGSCLATQGPDCSCIGGIGYLDCVSAAIATSNCWGTVGVVACEIILSDAWGNQER